MLQPGSTNQRSFPIEWIWFRKVLGVGKLAKPPEDRRPQSLCPALGKLLSALLPILLLTALAPLSGAAARPDPAPRPPLPASSEDALFQWEGLKIVRLDFAGVPASRLHPLTEHLAVRADSPFHLDALRRSLRQLYATGLYDGIQVEGAPVEGGITLLFQGTPRSFIGKITVEGAKGANLNTQLSRSGQLAPGVRFSQARLDQAVAQMRETLAANGFHEASITWTLEPHPADQLVDIAFHITSGPRARIGEVQIEGDPGMSAAEFRRLAHLRSGNAVDHDTSNRALNGVLRQYQHRDQLEAEIKIESQQYAAGSKKIDYRFYANQGPVVRVRVDGAEIPWERLRHTLPVFEEGAVDEDLLNEGNRRLRDYYQRQGYFDVRVEHDQLTAPSSEVTLVYRVTLGPRRSVGRVVVEGNHYFSTATLRNLLSVHTPDSVDRHGAYSQALIAADVASLQAVYQNNGFSKVKVTPETALLPLPPGAGAKKTAPLLVTYHIAEGEQMHISTVRIEGVEHGSPEMLLAQLNSTPGQLFSPQILASDRDALLTDFLSRGFDQARIEVVQQPTAEDPNRFDVIFRVHEGRQIFVRNVLLTGLHFTRPDTVARAITLHPGDPLNQTALAETQRNLYEFALFNEINTAIENDAGGESYKTVLIQASEARRWVLNYGGGFEMQTGTPANNCANINAGFGAQLP